MSPIYHVNLYSRELVGFLQKQNDLLSPLTTFFYAGSFCASTANGAVVQKELEGKDITLLVEGGLKTREDIGERCHFHLSF